jgi:hypothetical protein
MATAPKTHLRRLQVISGAEKSVPAPTIDFRCQKLIAGTQNSFPASKTHLRRQKLISGAKIFLCWLTSPYLPPLQSDALDTGFVFLDPNEGGRSILAHLSR